MRTDPQPCLLPGRMCEARPAGPGHRSGQQFGRDLRIGIDQERLHPGHLVGLLEQRSGLTERGQRTQEALVRLVRPRHRAGTLPTVAAQHVQTAVVADPGIGITRDVVPAVQRRSASTAQARDETGRRRTTLSADSPAASSAAAGSTGRRTGGGPSRLDWLIRRSCHPLRPTGCVDPNADDAQPNCAAIAASTCRYCSPARPTRVASACRTPWRWSAEASQRALSAR